MAFVRQLPPILHRQRILAKNESGSFRKAGYQALNDVDRDQAYRELRAMVDHGYLEAPEHPGQGAVYRVKITSAGSQTPLQARSPNGAVQSLQSRMDGKGFLKNLDYQQCFGVSRQAANKGLSELVESSVLTPENGRRYFTGPNWEAWIRPTQ